MELLFNACAIGEIAVGIVVALFPRPLCEFLLGAPVTGLGAVIARVAGIAIAMLGLTWWLARRELDTRLTSIAPGFVGYNLGVGLLFLAYALGARTTVTVAWLVAAAHLLVAFTFGAALLVRQRQSIAS